MSPNPSRSGQFPSACARVHRDLLANNEAIGHEFADRLARIGVGYFVDFVRVEPDFALAASHYGGSEPFLSAKVHPESERKGLAGS